ncbi:MAG: response regulator, partial [Pseudolabrys sp.]
RKVEQLPQPNNRNFYLNCLVLTQRSRGFMANKQIEKMLQGLTILVQRRLTRTMLTNLGAKSVLEAPDGLAALEAIRTADPDVMLLDWDMPVLNGSQNF